MNLEKSKTLQCVINAFAGESQANRRYLLFAKAAKKEELGYISKIFTEIAENEAEHAKLFYKHIPNAEYAVNGKYPFHTGNTYENLISASKGEREEWEIVYKDGMLTAKEEGFKEIEKLFNNIISIEKRHAHKFETIAQELKSETLYKKEENSQWICTKCGYTHIGKEAPCKCPVCDHPQGYFQPYEK